MGTVAVIGEETRVRGFGLVGAAVFPADEPAAVRAAWAGLPGDVSLVILTRAAADALSGASPNVGDRLVAVMP
jgi:vacuolar-type H+-ATPase subunit F/Vma7